MTMTASKTEVTASRKSAGPPRGYIQTYSPQARRRAMTAVTIAQAIGGPIEHTGRGFLVRCVAHADRTPSLRLSDGPDGKLLVRCFAGCEQADVLAALRPLTLYGEIAAANCGTNDAEPLPSREESDRERTAAALRIWREARHDPEALGIYLAARGITIPPPPSLRCHGALPHHPTGLHMPCMVAGVQAPDRAVVAVHRTYLRADLNGKAGVRLPKMALGPMGDGAVRLAHAGDALALAEGVETALSAMQLFGVPCWAALGSRLHKIAIPPQVREIHLFGDNGGPGHEAVEKAAARFTAEGRRVLIRYPSHEYSDWNDALVATRTAA